MSNEKKAPIDVEFLRGVIDNDVEFERELFEIFLDNADQNIAKMQNAIKDEDTNSWYMSSHAFKGASASIGAFELSKILELAQKAMEDDNDNKNSILSQIKEEYGEVKSFIKNEMDGN